uniref:protein DCL, chloroplastic-like n=1 Tax=Erigeron canadensis TaxID=72917 RepID=UPI001CB9424C|nr:protein DCL, chloroplastic-like [Erigeron canadensis]
MKSISSSFSQNISLNPKTTPLSLQFHFSSTNPSILSFPYSYKPTFCALKTSSDNGGSNPQQGGGGGFSAAELLRKPILGVKEKRSENENEEGRWVDYEDQILEDTVPLVGFVRMILHSGKYESGERLSLDHQSMILQRLLAHHPECEKKIGCGIDYITVDHHPDFDGSRCLFIVRKNGERVDFSYWKCIKGLIRKKYPLHADTFILQHFRRRRFDG